MATEVSCKFLRDNLATVLNQVGEGQEAVIIRRRGAPDVAIIPAAQLKGPMETSHLLRSPTNARLLLTALRRSERHGGKASTVAQLW